MSIGPDWQSAVSRPPTLFERLQALEVQPNPPAEEFVKLATEAIKKSEPLIAFDVTSTGLEHHPRHARLLQKRVEALLRSGSVERARQILDDLRRPNEDDEEVLGFFGRVDKEVWWRNRTSADARRYLKLAINAYLHAFRASKQPAYWSGINAATLAACAGDGELSSQLAREVQMICQQRLAQASDDERYWLLATLGEAALVLEDEARAEQWYRQAAESAGRDFGDIASTRRNARMLLVSRGQDAAQVLEWLPIPRVIVFSGHMIDRPGRPVPRFPVGLVDSVTQQIRNRLKKEGVSYAFASAACGGDLMFLQAALEAGGDVHVVIPFEREQFFATSVEFSGEPWISQFRRLFSESDERVRVTELSARPSMNTARDFEYCNLILYGLARVRSLEIESDLAALAVWNQRAGDGIGGTSNTVEFWRGHGLEPDVIDLAQLAGEQGIETGAAASPPVESRAGGAPSTKVAAMLFADAKGFSKLPDDQMLPFVEQYLVLLRELINRCDFKPMLLNTWGDGLYMVFDSVRDAGIFALKLCDELQARRTDGTLRLDIRLRVALHAGPVLPCHNPATNRPDVIGTHVTRAARLEPVTPTGQVYATEAFAALAYAEHVDEFRCDYVGPTPLDKGYGTVRVYHVRWWH